MTTKTVRADQVREGDWVRWPADSDTMRRICEIHLVKGESMEARAYSAYDDYEYEWAAHQPVEIFRA